MIKTALEETRLLWWKTNLFLFFGIYNKTKFSPAIRRAARYAAKIDGYLGLKQMEWEERGWNE